MTVYNWLCSRDHTTDQIAERQYSSQAFVVQESITYGLEVVGARKRVDGNSRGGLGLCFRPSSQLKGHENSISILVPEARRPGVNRMELTGSSDLLTGHDHVRSERDVEGSLEVDIVLGQETGNEASL